ncbi:hypothetical protein ENSA7_64900 [Enhygromyxa salina]|uniref:KAP NTPase domain-containing protein n=2 Tax=Enhygromyxa salina TaxID=215803 RepID=A0A2S9Y098_9BACT|nr:hypothetical protein ENSA7_64900 [Enhygromyxa salina]
MVHEVPNEHIRSYLDYYSTIAGPPGFAVLVNGQWGVGKTWFIKEKVIGNDHDDYLYVSLYGVSSEEEFFERALVQLNPWLENAGIAIAGRLVKALATMALSVSIGDGGKVGGRADAAAGLIADAKQRGIDSAIDRRILIVDDVERSLMAPRQLWGLVNGFVEQRGAKLLIVANDDEFADVDEFRRTKEKNIEMTLTVQPDVAGALDSFISGQPEAARALMISRKDDIARTFRASGYHNLRVLRFAVRNFVRIHGALSDEVRGNEAAIDSLVRTAFPLAFEVHTGALAGRLDVGVIRRLAGVRDDDDGGRGDIGEIEKKYGPAYPFTVPCPSLAWWSDLVFSGKLDAAKLNRSLEARFIDIENQPDWKRLANFAWLSDAQFEELLERTWNDLVAGDCREFGALLHVAGVRVWAVTKGFIEGDIDEVVALAKRGLDGLDEAAYLDLARCLARHDRILEAYDSIAYAGRDEAGFAAIQDHARTLAEEFVAARVKLEANRLWDRLQDGSCAAFCSALGVEPGALDPILLREDILCELDPREFADRVEGFDVQEQESLASALWARFHRRKSTREQEWLEAVLRELDGRPAKMQRHFSKQRLRRVLGED